VCIDQARREEALVSIGRLKLTRPLLITFVVLSSAEHGDREIYRVSCCQRRSNVRTTKTERCG
jgi:hypothetical protein